MRPAPPPVPPASAPSSRSPRPPPAGVGANPTGDLIEPEGDDDQGSHVDSLQQQLAAAQTTIAKLRAQLAVAQQEASQARAKSAAWEAEAVSSARSMQQSAAASLQQDMDMREAEQRLSSQDTKLAHLAHEVVRARVQESIYRSACAVVVNFAGCSLPTPLTQV